MPRRTRQNFWDPPPQPDRKSTVNQSSIVIQPSINLDNRFADRKSRLDNRFADRKAETTNYTRLWDILSTSSAEPSTITDHTEKVPTTDTLTNIDPEILSKTSIWPWSQEDGVELSDTESDDVDIGDASQKDNPGPPTVLKYTNKLSSTEALAYIAPRILGEDPYLELYVNDAGIAASTSIVLRPQKDSRAISRASELQVHDDDDFRDMYLDKTSGIAASTSIVLRPQKDSRAIIRASELQVHDDDDFRDMYLDKTYDMSHGPSTFTEPIEKPLSTDTSAKIDSEADKIGGTSTALSNGIPKSFILHPKVRYYYHPQHEVFYDLSTRSFYKPSLRSSVDWNYNEDNYTESRCLHIPRRMAFDLDIMSTFTSECFVESELYTSEDFLADEPTNDSQPMKSSSYSPTAQGISSSHDCQPGQTTFTPIVDSKTEGPERISSEDTADNQLMKPPPNSCYTELISSHDHQQLSDQASSLPVVKSKLMRSEKKNHSQSSLTKSTEHRKVLNIVNLELVSRSRLINKQLEQKQERRKRNTSNPYHQSGKKEKKKTVCNSPVPPSGHSAFRPRKSQRIQRRDHKSERLVKTRLHLERYDYPMSSRLASGSRVSSITGSPTLPNAAATCKLHGTGSRSDSTMRASSAPPPNAELKCRNCGMWNSLPVEFSSRSFGSTEPDKKKTSKSPARSRHVPSSPVSNPDTSSEESYLDHTRQKVLKLTEGFDEDFVRVKKMYAKFIAERDRKEVLPTGSQAVSRDQTDLTCEGIFRPQDPPADMTVKMLSENGTYDTPANEIPRYYIDTRNPGYPQITPPTLPLNNYNYQIPQNWSHSSIQNGSYYGFNSVPPWTQHVDNQYWRGFSANQTFGYNVHLPSYGSVQSNQRHHWDSSVRCSDITFNYPNPLGIPPTEQQNHSYRSEGRNRNYDSPYSSLSCEYSPYPENISYAKFAEQWSDNDHDRSRRNELHKFANSLPRYDEGSNLYPHNPALHSSTSANSVEHPRASSKRSWNDTYQSSSYSGLISVFPSDRNNNCDAGMTEPTSDNDSTRTPPSEKSFVNYELAVSLPQISEISKPHALGVEPVASSSTSQPNISGHYQSEMWDVMCEGQNMSNFIGLDGSHSDSDDLVIDTSVESLNISNSDLGSAEADQEEDNLATQPKTPSVQSDHDRSRQNEYHKFAESLPRYDEGSNLYAHNPALHSSASTNSVEHPRASSKRSWNDTYQSSSYSGLSSVFPSDRNNNCDAGMTEPTSDNDSTRTPPSEKSFVNHELAVSLPQISEISKPHVLGVEPAASSSTYQPNIVENPKASSGHYQSEMWDVMCEGQNMSNYIICLDGSRSDSDDLIIDTSVESLNISDSDLGSAEADQEEDNLATQPKTPSVQSDRDRSHQNEHHKFAKSLPRYDEGSNLYAHNPALHSSASTNSVEHPRASSKRSWNDTYQSSSYSVLSSVFPSDRNNNCDAGMTEPTSGNDSTRTPPSEKSFVNHELAVSLPQISEISKPHVLGVEPAASSSTSQPNIVENPKASSGHYQSEMWDVMCEGQNMSNYIICLDGSRSDSDDLIIDTSVESLNISDSDLGSAEADQEEDNLATQPKTPSVQSDEDTKFCHDESMRSSLPYEVVEAINDAEFHDYKRNLNGCPFFDDYEIHNHQNTVLFCDTGTNAKAVLVSPIPLLKSAEDAKAVRSELEDILAIDGFVHESIVVYHGRTMGTPTHYACVEFQNFEAAFAWHDKHEGFLYLTERHGGLRKREAQMRLSSNSRSWACSFCQTPNFAQRFHCHKCYRHKQSGSAAIVVSPSPTRYLALKSSLPMQTLLDAIENFTCSWGNYFIETTGLPLGLCVVDLDTPQEANRWREELRRGGREAIFVNCEIQLSLKPIVVKNSIS